MPRHESSLVRNSWHSVGTLAIILGLKFSVSLIVIRFLGPVGQGQYYLVISFSGLVLQLLSLGVGTASSVFVCRTDYDMGEVNTACVLLSCFFGLVAALLYALLQPMLHATILKGIPTIYGWLAILMLPFTLYGLYWRGLVIGLERIGLLNKIELSGFVLQFALLVILMSAGGGLMGALTAWAGNGLFLSVVGLGSIVSLKDVRWTVNSSLMKQLVRFGAASQWGEIARVLVLRSDVFLLNLFWGQEVVGYYSVALSLTEKLWITYTGMYRASTHRIQSLSRDQALRLLAKINRLMGSIALVMIVCLVLLSKWLIPFLYGTRYIPSVGLFNILLFSLIPYGLWAGVRIYITGQLMLPQLTSIIHWMSFLISFVIYYFLIISYQAVGAALGSVGAYLILCIVGLVVLHRYVSFRPSIFFVPTAAELAHYLTLGFAEYSRLRNRIGRPRRGM